MQSNHEKGHLTLIDVITLTQESHLNVSGMHNIVIVIQRGVFNCFSQMMHDLSGKINCIHVKVK